MSNDDLNDAYATYDDIMQILENDRDDRDDQPTGSYYDGDYCPHGVYVGGCGTDWMCHWCEDGISLAEAKRIVTMERTRATRERADRAQAGLALLLRHGIGGIDAAIIAQESSYTVNPRSRYGRH